jgi:hypothetical protein
MKSKVKTKAQAENEVLVAALQAVVADRRALIAHLKKLKAAIDF